MNDKEIMHREKMKALKKTLQKIKSGGNPSMACGEYYYRFSCYSFFQH